MGQNHQVSFMKSSKIVASPKLSEVSSLTRRNTEKNRGRTKCPYRELQKIYSENCCVPKAFISPSTIHTLLRFSDACKRAVYLILTEHFKELTSSTLLHCLGLGL